LDNEEISVDTQTDKDTTTADATTGKPNVSATTDKSNVSQEDLQGIQDQLTKQQSDLDGKQALIDKLRGNEKHNQQLAKDSGAKNLEEALRSIQQGATTEALDYKVKLEASETELKALKGALERTEKSSLISDELTKFNVKSASTAIKLLSLSDITISDGKVDATQLEEQVNKLKSSDPTLFNDVKDTKIPKVRQADNNDEGTTDFKTDLDAAKNEKEVMAVLKKHKKI
jgi:hypothetical protein